MNKMSDSRGTFDRSSFKSVISTINRTVLGSGARSRHSNRKETHHPSSSKRKRGVGLAFAVDKDDSQEVVVWETSPERKAPRAAGLPPRRAEPTGSFSSGIRVSDIGSGDSKPRFLNSSQSANSDQNELLTFEESYSQMDFFSESDQGAARKHDEILQLKMDAISSMHDDMDGFSGSFATNGASSDEMLQRHVHIHSSDATPVILKSAHQSEDSRDVASPTFHIRSDLIGSEGPYTNTSGCLSVSSALPAGVDSQTSEGPSQPDFIDSVVNMQMFPAYYEINSIDNDRANSASQSQVIAATKERYAAPQLPPKRTLLTTDMFDMGIDEMALDMLDHLETQARQQLKKERLAPPAQETMLNILKQDSSAGVGFDSNFDDMDFAALDALEKSALDKLSEKKRHSSENISGDMIEDPVHIVPPLIMRRCIALSVSSAFDAVTGQREKIIMCIPAESMQNENTCQGQLHKVVLRGEDWYQTDVAGGDIFNYLSIGECDRPGNCTQQGRSDIFGSDELTIGVVDERDGVIIIHPDTLVTPSRISDALNCPRKGVLSDRVRSYDGVGMAGTMGTVKHAFIEAALGYLLGRNTESRGGVVHAGSTVMLQEDVVSRFSAEAIKGNVESLLACKANESCPSVDQQLRQLVPDIVSLVQICSSIGILIQMDGPYEKQPDEAKQNIGGNRYLSCLFYVFDSVVDIEETVWSPIIGLKGQVDAVIHGHLERRAYEEEMNTLLHNFRDSILCASIDTSNYTRLTSPLHCQPLYSFAAPMEVKTGKWRPGSVVPHKAQTLLYLLMLWTRERCCPSTEHISSSNGSFHGNIPDFGILAYIGNDILKVETVCDGWSHMRSLIIARNKQAMHVRLCAEAASNPLPPVIQSKSQCVYCFQAAECMTFHALLEKGDETTSGVPELFKYSLRGFLKQPQRDYFALWNRLLDLEASTSVSSLYETWAVPSIVLEERGSACLGQLTLVSCLQEADGNECSRLLLARSASKSYHEDLQSSATKHKFSVGDKVIVSLEKVNEAGVFAVELKYVDPNVCSGTVVRLKKDSSTGVNIIVEILVARIPRRILGIFKVRHGVVVESNDINKILAAAPKYWRLRLDNDEISFGVATMRTNLLKLFVSPHSPNEFHEKNAGCIDSGTPLPEAGSTRMRSLLIDLNRPQFCLLSGDDLFPPTSSPGSVVAYTKPIKKDETFVNKAIYPGCHPVDIQREFSLLNLGQKDAVKKVICANDYVLMLGMPGTGKTSTVALIIRTLVARGKRVLVASYTHSAVDHLMLKLKDAGIDKKMMLRLGNAGSIDSRLQSYIVDQSSCVNMAVLQSRVHSARVVGCTVLSAARNALLECVAFDWCVMDEAGQISQPAALGPLLRVERFVLVGDDYQLPPLIVSAEAKSLGMDTSLFKRLAEAHPHAVVSLRAQYRMNNDIMAVSNTLIYEHKLFCATAKTAFARISLPNENLLPFPTMWNHRNCGVPGAPRTDWLFTCLSPDNAVVFLDTDKLDHPLPSSNKSLVDPIAKASLENILEVELIHLIMQGFDTCKFDLGKVGIISPYRAQVSIIRKSLSHLFDAERMDPIDENAASERNAVVLCDIDTVDKFQGRDMEVTIISTVKNKEDTTIGDLLRDWRRVNVAVTRAQKKLIIIGSLSVMQKIPILNLLRDTVLERKWVVSVPQDGVSMYSSMRMNSQQE